MVFNQKSDFSVIFISYVTHTGAKYKFFRKFIFFKILIFFNFFVKNEPKFGLLEKFRKLKISGKTHILPQCVTSKAVKCYKNMFSFDRNTLSVEEGQHWTQTLTKIYFFSYIVSKNSFLGQTSCLVGCFG